MSLYGGDIPFWVWMILLFFLFTFGVAYFKKMKDGNNSNNCFKTRVGDNTNNGIIGNSNTINFKIINPNTQSPKSGKGIDNQPSTKNIILKIDKESRKRINRFYVAEAIRIVSEETNSNIFVKRYVQALGELEVSVDTKDVSKVAGALTRYFYDVLNIKNISIQNRII